MTGGSVGPEERSRTAACLLQLQDGLHSWGLRVFREAAAAKQGAVGDSHQDQCSASSEAGRGTGCLPWPTATSSKSLSQSCSDARRPELHGLCYRSGKRDNDLAFDIFVWGRTVGREKLDLTSFRGCEFLSCPIFPLTVPFFLSVSLTFYVSLLQFSICLLFLKLKHTHTHAHIRLCLSVDISLCLPFCLRTSASQCVWHSDCV